MPLLSSKILRSIPAFMGSSTMLRVKDIFDTLLVFVGTYSKRNLLEDRISRSLFLQRLGMALLVSGIEEAKRIDELESHGSINLVFDSNPDTYLAVTIMVQKP